MAKLDIPKTCTLTERVTHDRHHYTLKNLRDDGATTVTRFCSVKGFSFQQRQDLVDDYARAVLVADGLLPIPANPDGFEKALCMTSRPGESPAYTQIKIVPLEGILLERAKE